MTDLSMPDMSAPRARRRHPPAAPRLPVVLLTGDTDADVEGTDVAAVVKKPFQLDALDAAVREVAGTA